MELVKYNKDFRESVGKLGFQAVPSYVSNSDEYVLRFYYDDIKGNINTLIELSATIKDYRLVLPFPSVIKLGGGLDAYLGIYEYYIGLAKILGLRKIEIDKAFYSNQRNQFYNEHAEFLSLCLMLGLKNNLPGKITIESNPNLNLIPILKDVIIARKELLNEESALSMEKIQALPSSEINKGQLFLFKYLWDGVKDEINILLEDGTFYLSHNQNRIELTGTNAKKELCNILAEVSENQKLANLLDPPVDNLFKFISNTIDSEKRPLTIYRTIAKNLMDEFIGLGYEYLEVEREASVLTNRVNRMNSKIELIKDCYISRFFDKYLVFMKGDTHHFYRICNEYSETVAFITNKVESYLNAITKK